MRSTKGRLVLIITFIMILIGTFFCAYSSDEKNETVKIITFIISLIFILTPCLYLIVELEKIIIKRKSKLDKILLTLIAIVFLSLPIIFIIRQHPTRRTFYTKAVCKTHLSGLGKSIMTYAHEKKELFPDTNNWCDLLILFEDAHPKEFICMASDAEVGESSYAMNINLNGKKLKDVDPNTVVLFDTNYGKDPNGRDVTVSSHYSYKILKEKGEDVSIFGKNPEKRKVYKKRWNQAGGPEMLTAENHKGDGANILFADGSVRWIPKEDFNNLNWGKP